MRAVTTGSIVIGGVAGCSIAYRLAAAGGSTVVRGLAPVDETGAASGTCTVPATEGGTAGTATFAAGGASVAVSIDVARGSW